MLGLPDGITACLFDMDGVVTNTAVVHAAAWKQMFDEFLRVWSARNGREFVPFDSVRDYDEYVDGKPRLDGTESFLQSRGIQLPEGTPSDSPGTPTVQGLSNRKNELVLEVLHRDGVEVYPGSRRYLDAVRKAGLKTAIVSSSANTEAVLKAGGVADLFDVRVDAQVATERGLHGKPAPDTYLEAARMLGVDAANAAVFEDALVGVAAGRAGKFGFVVGVDRVGQADELRARGADTVVKDLGDLLLPLLPLLPLLLAERPSSLSKGRKCPRRALAAHRTRRCANDHERAVWRGALEPQRGQPRPEPARAE